MFYWIGIFGVMGVIMIDNGEEFYFEEMWEVVLILNVKVCIFVGESLF